MWQMFLNFAISTLLSELLRPKAHFDRPKPAGLDEITYPTASEDRAMPVAWGTVKQEGLNLLWHGDLKTVEKVKRVRTGLFTKEDMHEGYHYYIGMQMGLCVDGVDELREVWAGEAKIYTGTAPANSIVTVSGSWKEGEQDSGMEGQIAFHSGDTVPDPYMATQVSVNPSFKHMTYCTFLGPSSTGGWNNGYVGLNPNLRPLKFVIRRLPKVVRYGVSQADYSAYAAVGTYDANPAFCMLEAACNSDWGGGVPPEMVDIETIVECAQKLHLEGNGLSLLWDSPRPVWDIIAEMLKQVNGVMYTDLTTGLLTMKLLRAENGIVFEFNEDNVTRLENFTRASADEATNAVRLPFKDILAGFIERAAVSHDLGGIEAAGQIIPATVQYPGVSSLELAVKLVVRDLRMAAATLAKVSVSAVLPVGVYLHPGDLVTLTWGPLSLQNLGMRVLQVRYADSGRGGVTLDLVQDIFLPGVSIYSGSVPALNASTGARARPGYINMLGGVLAPYGLTKSEANRALVWAFAPDANTTSYDLAYYNDSDNPNLLEWDQRSGVGFAALGSLLTTVPQAPTVANITLSVNSTNAAVLKRYGSQPVLFSIDNEMFQAGAIVLNAAGTQVTLSSITRALWDTVPATHSAAQYNPVVLWCDYVIDPSPLKTIVQTQNGTTIAAHDGQRNVHFKARGRNSNGMGPLGASGDVGTNFSQDGLGTLRAALPYPPGNVKLAGAIGTGTKETGTAIAGTSALLTWTPRSRMNGGLSPWSTGDQAAEVGVTHESRVDAYVNNSWVNVATGLHGAGVNSLSVNLANTPKGAPLRASIFAVKSGVYSNPQNWFFTLMA